MLMVYTAGLMFFLLIGSETARYVERNYPDEMLCYRAERAAPASEINPC